MKKEVDNESYKVIFNANGGTSIEKYIAEAGIDGNLTFFAQWEENSSVLEGTPVIPEGGEQENNNTENTDTGIGTETETDSNDENIDTNKPTGSNPQTGDNVILFVEILLVAIVGIIITTKVSKNIKNN